MKHVTFIFLLTMASLTTGFSASAGDFATRHIHGFSADGGLFAFEEYGVQDGSGFPYASIFVIDTATDQWVAGSPFKILLDDETKTVFEAREGARILAGPVMKSFEAHGDVVATNRATETGFDKTRISANPRFVVPPIDAEIEFRLERKTFAPSPLCEVFGESAGFKLTEIATNPDQTTRIIHEDTSLPSSRGCPLGYEFADLVTYFPPDGEPVAAVLILMKRVGFEGPDGRFLAVTTKLQR